MASTREEAEQALLDAIVKEAAYGGTHGKNARDYAEALAWLIDPNQPHGGHSTSTP